MTAMMQSVISKVNALALSSQDVLLAFWLEYCLHSMSIIMMPSVIAKMNDLALSGQNALLVHFLWLSSALAV